MKVFVVTEQGVDGVYGVCLKEADAEEMCASNSDLEYSEEIVNTGGEPVFLLRGQDMFASAGIRGYGKELEKHGQTEQVAQVQLALEEMFDWQGEHIDLLKRPDHQHQPVAGG